MRAWCFAACVMLGACGPGEWRPPAEADSHEDPARLRPGYGNDQLHVWWPLTGPEVAALAGAQRAREGDAHALFALAIFASGDVRDDASYARYTRRFDDFIETQRASITGATDDAKRGDLLNRAMHATFLTGTPNKSDPKMGAYELDQARVSQVFEQGHYNCISSAILYVTLARAFGLSVRGAVTDTHAFVDFGPADGPRVDVETTTKTGFGETHDEKFYRESAKDWSSSRGLRPMTFDDYKKREIVPPHVLVARLMNDKRTVNDATTGRLAEAAAILAPDDHDSLHNRMVSYINESKWLFDHKASRTILRLVEVASPFISDVPNRFPNDDTLLADVAWMAWYDANSLLVIGRGDEAMAIVDDVFPRVKPSWREGELLRRNYVSVITDRLTELQVRHDYERSVAVVQKHVAACQAEPVCLNNLYLTFDAWCASYQAAKDWPNAKKIMDRCIALLPGDTRCHDTLEKLTSLHP